MTDRELLELSAKAAGLPWDKWVIEGDDSWNPIIDDGDALRLAVKMGMQVDMRSPATRVFGAPSGCTDEHHKRDPYAATRRAIVRAAAEIGRKQT